MLQSCVTFALNLITELRRGGGGRQGVRAAGSLRYMRQVVQVVGLNDVHRIFTDKR